MQALQYPVEKLIIRYLRRGCANRPFFYISVCHVDEVVTQPGFEQIGTYDPIPNENGERLVAINVDRLKFWIGQGVGIGRGVGVILGLGGLLPIHPRTIIRGWKTRIETENQETENSSKENN